MPERHRHLTKLQEPSNLVGKPLFAGGLSDRLPQGQKQRESKRNRRLLAGEIVRFVSQEENWKRRLTLKEIGAQFKIDPSDAGDLFRSVTTKTIFRCQEEKRFEYVVARVHSDYCDASELAEELNYSDEHSFTRWIKSRTGVSWTELCEKIRNGSKSPVLKRPVPRKRRRQRPSKIDTQE